MTTATFSVSNATQLAAALKLATGGETINLAAGNYGSLTLGSFNPTAMVTIQSFGGSGLGALGGGRASFTGITATSSQNLTFSGMEVTKIKAPGESDAPSMVNIYDSRNINLLNLDVHGSLNHNPIDDQVGMRIVSGHDIQVANSTFHDLYVGIGFQNVTALGVTNNTIYEVREGMDFAAIHHGLIDHNLIHSIIPNYVSDPSIVSSIDPALNAADHPDSIQFWTINAGPSDDVTLSNNTLLMGHGQDAHGIFMGASNGDKFTNILIQNNLISTNNFHGISLYDTIGAVIDHNTVLTTTGAQFDPSINVVASTNVAVTNNVSTYYGYKDNGNVTWTSNLTVHAGGANDSTKMESNFANPLKAGTFAVGDFAKIAGSLVATSGAGFDMAAYNTKVPYASYDALIHSLDAGAFLHHIA